MIFDKLAEDVLRDEYFLWLFSNLSQNTAHGIFGDTPKFNFNEKQLIDLLRFSDILSNSKKSNFRNLAYRTVSLLHLEFSNNPFYKTYSSAILTQLGNFPGLSLLESGDNTLELPFDRQVVKEVKEMYQAIPGTQSLFFTDSQYELFTTLQAVDSFSFSGPTSMGKSFIIRQFIHKLLLEGEETNIAVVVPTRALINQFSYDLRIHLKDALDRLNYRVMTNSNVSELVAEKNQNHIFVLTPERLISYLSQKNNPLIEYMFVDEAHKLASGKNDYRSVTTYLAIKEILGKFPNIKLYFASPIVSNPQVFLELFGKNSEGKHFYTNEKTVQQNMFYLDMFTQKVTHYDSFNNYTFEPNRASGWAHALDVVFDVGKGQSNIVYCNSRKDTVGNAQEFKKYIKEKSEDEEIRKAIKLVKTYLHKDYYLVDCLAYGIAFHFGSLPQLIRNKVEELFRRGKIKYLFCTSTLLEGVNLPAKNVFILRNKKGGSRISPIDFRNLGGRAGRLRQELYGNVICIKQDEADWKDLGLLNTEQEIEVEPTITNKTENKIKAIGKLLQGEEIKGTVEEKEILKYISNIITAEVLAESDNCKYDDRLLDKVDNEYKIEIIKHAKKIASGIKIPTSIIRSSQSIDIQLQDKTYKHLKTQSKSEIKLPNEINYINCHETLKGLYKYYRWDLTERYLKNKNSLKYYAFLMNVWINDTSLNEIINQSIDSYERNNRKIRINGVDEIFSKTNKTHVNVLIDNLIEDIDKRLRYTLEKYFNHYYLILTNLLGEEKAGPNWALFLEYGTRNSLMIALQNLGFSRQTANYTFKNHSDCLKMDDNGKLVGINKDKLKRDLNFESAEAEEIADLL